MSRSKDTIELTDSEMQAAFNTGRLRCPYCEREMKYLKTGGKPVRDEFYCENCDVSAPLYAKI